MVIQTGFGVLQPSGRQRKFVGNRVEEGLHERLASSAPHCAGDALGIVPSQ